MDGRQNPANVCTKGVFDPAKLLDQGKSGSHGCMVQKTLEKQKLNFSRSVLFDMKN